MDLRAFLPYLEKRASDVNSSKLKEEILELATGKPKEELKEESFSVWDKLRSKVGNC